MFNLTKAKPKLFPHEPFKMIRLCEIYDKYEFSDVVTEVMQPSGGSAFFGISDIAIEGIYQWITGDTSIIEELGIFAS